MTFAEIDRRLDLFPEYLRYWIDKRTDEIIIEQRFYALTGKKLGKISFPLDEQLILSFDDWLLFNEKQIEKQIEYFQYKTERLYFLFTTLLKQLPPPQ